MPAPQQANQAREEGVNQRANAGQTVGSFRVVYRGRGRQEWVGLPGTSPVTRGHLASSVAHRKASAAKRQAESWWEFSLSPCLPFSLVGSAWQLQKKGLPSQGLATSCRERRQLRPARTFAREIRRRLPTLAQRLAGPFADTRGRNFIGDLCTGLVIGGMFIRPASLVPSARGSGSVCRRKGRPVEGFRRNSGPDKEIF